MARLYLHKIGKLHLQTCMRDILEWVELKLSVKIIKLQTFTRILSLQHRILTELSLSNSSKKQMVG